MTIAPVILIYVVDITKYGKSRLQEPGLRDAEIQKSYYNVACGLIAGNVYLFAASQGLAAWFHNCNKPRARRGIETKPPTTRPVCPDHRLTGQEPGVNGFLFCGRADNQQFK